MIIRNWIIRWVVDRVEFAGMYPRDRNFWIHAKLIDGAVVLDNPRGVRIPNYAMEEVKRLLSA